MHSHGGRDRFEGKTYILRDASGDADHGQTWLFSLLFSHPFPVSKEKEFIASARTVREQGGWRKGLTFKMGLKGGRWQIPLENSERDLNKVK